MIYYQPTPKTRFSFKVKTKTYPEGRTYYATYLDTIFQYIRESIVDDESDTHLIELNITLLSLEEKDDEG
jgi:hypothetical protein